jgi:hypothetical protein
VRVVACAATVHASAPLAGDARRALCALGAAAAFAPGLVYADEPSEAPRSDAATLDPIIEEGADLDELAPRELEVEYAQYGVAIAGETRISTGNLCPSNAPIPCIFGSGGGPTLRGGWRPPGPWYVGGAYQFAKLDSNNLYRLGVLQQLRGEARYYVDTESRFTPYAYGALGGVVYGNEFSVQTGGASAAVGLGIELEITRFALLGLALAYEPMVFAGFIDTAGQRRSTDVAQFLRVELLFELRTELGRR